MFNKRWRSSKKLIQKGVRLSERLVTVEELSDIASIEFLQKRKSNFLLLRGLQLTQQCMRRSLGAKTVEQIKVTALLAASESAILRGAAFEKPDHMTVDFLAVLSRVKQTALS